MKVAVIGCGSMGNVHAHAYAKMNDVELTAVCDIQMERAEAIAERTGAVAYPSFEHMLAEAEFDVISITLPSYLHKEYTIRAAEAGKHVISEKPLALTLEDAQAMIECCDRQGVRLFVGHVVRFFPEYAQIKQVIDQGKIGRVAVVHTKRRGSHPGLASPWFKEADKSGGILFDLMIHDIDYLRWTVGDVKSVYAKSHTDQDLEFAFVTLQFENGAVANLEVCWGYPGSFHTGIEVAGSKGVVRNNSESSNSVRVRQISSDKPGQAPVVEVPKSPGAKSPYELELEHYIACIRTGDTAIVTAQDAYQAIEIAKAAADSAKTGKVVSLQASRVQEVTK